MVASGESVNEIRDGWTPLIVAARDGQFPVVKYLAEDAKADLDGKNLDGFTALISASEEGNLEIVQYLTDMKCTIDVKDAYGDTALIYASRIPPFIEVVRHLVEEALADPWIPGSRGLNALQWAQTLDNESAVKYILSYRHKLEEKAMKRDLMFIEMMFGTIKDAIGGVEGIQAPPLEIERGSPMEGQM
eukprot:CAMPEP_0167756474 /NCGR_PEP_ID=MMETSP0110_2-20121227/9405_1 /TAXON_ID=629695 /ORGANISM="Gymnochlora sp., Strain CCMP2014" /LENGTH=188 /DNA_ID=CAMNT_0007642587 /DNA_START=143 /DNA_END=709 /DNA_ORIENTATION=-